jgi:hypothetical protein
LPSMNIDLISVSEISSFNTKNLIIIFGDLGLVQKFKI